MKSIIIFALFALLSGCLCCGSSLGGEGDVGDAPSMTVGIKQTTSTLKAMISPTTTLAEAVEESTSTTTTTSSTTSTTISCLKVPPSEKLDCYIGWASRAGDEKICENLRHYNEKIVCKASVAKDVTVCNMIRSSPTDKDTCIKKIAVMNKEPLLCNSIRSPRTESKCISESRKE
ncbi:hypothetical protein ACFLRF_02970 [Candidatus Altiarchaeota archaeon]